MHESRGNMGMITPIDKLPNKAPSDETTIGDLNDPVVKEVLQEMQDSHPHRASPPPPQHHISHHNHVRFEQDMPYNQPQYQPPQMTNLNKGSTRLVDFKNVKDAIIVTIIVFIILYSGIFKHVQDYFGYDILYSQEHIIKSIILFIAVYAYQYASDRNMI